MQQIPTAFLIIALVITVNGAVSVVTKDGTVDQIAEEHKNRALTMVDGPKYVTPITTPPLTNTTTHKPEQRLPSKPPINRTQDITWKPKYIDLTRNYYNGKPLPKVPQRHVFQNPHLALQTNAVYKYPNVLTLPPKIRTTYYAPSTSNIRLATAASTGNPVSVTKNHKINLQIQTINGIRTDIVKPPDFLKNLTDIKTTTTVPTTTTQRILRTKRIWPQRILEKLNITVSNTTAVNDTTTDGNYTKDLGTSASSYRIRHAILTRQPQDLSTTEKPSTPRVYRRVTRKPKTTTPATNFTVEPNDWVPIIPTHYPYARKHNTKRISKRSINENSFLSTPSLDSSLTPAENRHTLYLQSYRLLPLMNAEDSYSNLPFGKKRSNVPKRIKYNQLHLSDDYNVKTLEPSFKHSQDDLQTEASHRHEYVKTKIKHHHHHHHHRYVKTVEKKVPYKVEVPKPYPVVKKVPYPVEKLKIIEKPVPYAVTVEKKVPYPIGIKVPHPVPVKVVEKEYVPKPFAVIQKVPVYKSVEVKVPVEKRVPYPVEVRVPVPVDRPVEKKVPYPVPVKVFVPQPYPVETKVPYPVEVKVKEPYEVIKHVPIKVPVPEPYPVKVPHPVPVHIEKQVPYPVEIEKRVPVYIPKPYPVEKKVPYPVKVPYRVKVPVKVPVEVPVEVPVFINVHPNEEIVFPQQTSYRGQYSLVENVETTTPEHTITVHGNTDISGTISRSDNNQDAETTTTPATS